MSTPELLTPYTDLDDHELWGLAMHTHKLVIQPGIPEHLQSMGLSHILGQYAVNIAQSYDSLAAARDIMRQPGGEQSFFVITKDDDGRASSLIGTATTRLEALPIKQRLPLPPAISRIVSSPEDNAQGIANAVEVSAWIDPRQTNYAEKTAAMLAQLRGLTSEDKWAWMLLPQAFVHKKHSPPARDYVDALTKSHFSNAGNGYYNDDKTGWRPLSRSILYKG